MDEVIKVILAGGGPAAGGILIFYLVKLEPRLKAIEEAIYTQGKIELLKLAANSQVAPELKEVALRMKDEIQTKMDKIRK